MAKIIPSRSPCPVCLFVPWWMCRSISIIVIIVLPFLKPMDRRKNSIFEHRSYHTVCCKLCSSKFYAILVNQKSGFRYPLIFPSHCSSYSRFCPWGHMYPYPRVRPFDSLSSSPLFLSPRSQLSTADLHYNQRDFQTLRSRWLFNHFLGMVTRKYYA